MQKIKCNETVLITLANKSHKNLWRHMKFISIKYRLDIISQHVQFNFGSNPTRNYLKRWWCLYFLTYSFNWHVGFQESIWRLIRTRTLSCGMWIVDLKTIINQWKTILYYNCICFFLYQLFIHFFPLISSRYTFSINGQTLILKIIGQCDVKSIMTLPIKTTMSGLRTWKTLLEYHSSSCQNLCEY